VENGAVAPGPHHKDKQKISKFLNVDKSVGALIIAVLIINFSQLT